MKYLLFLIIGIIIFLLLNNKENFSVGAPGWRDFFNRLFGCSPETLNMTRVLLPGNERIATNNIFILNINVINTIAANENFIEPWVGDKLHNHLIDFLIRNGLM